MTFAWLFGSSPKRKIKTRYGLRLECLEDRNTPSATSAISGAVFSDFNLNRIFDGNDRGLAGFTVNLTGTTNGGGSVVTSAITDANGSFQFTGLEAGTYTLDASQSFFNAPVGLASSFGGTVSGSAVQSISVGQGQSVTDVGFAVQTINPRAVVGFGFSLIQLFNVPTTTIIATAGGGSANFANNGDIAVGTGTASLAGTVYNDHGAAGLLETGDEGLAGITVQLNGQMNTGASITKTVVTGSDGTYSFTKTFRPAPISSTSSPRPASAPSPAMSAISAAR